VIGACFTLLKLRLQDATGSHSPDVLGPAADATLADQASGNAGAQQFQGFLPVEDANFVAEHLSDSGTTGGRETEITGIALVLRVPSIEQPLAKLLQAILGPVTQISQLAFGVVGAVASLQGC